MISEGRIKNYLLYALGEIVLVVVGILLALQVNNWNIRRINQGLEIEILEQLQDEFEANLDQIEQRQFIRVDLISKHASSLLEHVLNGNNVLPREEVAKLLSKTYLVPTFDPVNGVLNEIINSGKLQLISNKALRRKLSDWPSVTADLVGEEAQYKDYINNEYIPFMIKNYQIGYAVILNQLDEQIGAIIDADAKSTLDLDKIEPGTYNTLFTHPDFQDHLTLIIGFSNYLNKISGTVARESEAIIQLITDQSNPD